MEDSVDPVEQIEFDLGQVSVFEGETLVLLERAHVPSLDAGVVVVGEHVDANDVVAPENASLGDLAADEPRAARDHGASHRSRSLVDGDGQESVRMWR